MTIGKIERGGPQLALYLHDDEFVMPDGSSVVVRKSDIPTATLGMADVIARHKARYGLVGLFCRPDRKLLDFPCGSGYACEQLAAYGVCYEGRDIDAPTIEYARRHYGHNQTSFAVDDLCSSHLGDAQFDIVACIEGIEHIEAPFQGRLIGRLARALRPGGVLIISSPEAIGNSGPSDTNPEHLWELSRADFESLLGEAFGSVNVEIVSQRGVVLTTGVETSCLYGVCHRIP